MWIHWTKGDDPTEEGGLPAMKAWDEVASEKTKCSLSDSDTFELVNNLNKDLEACLEGVKRGRKKCPEGIMRELQSSSNRQEWEPERGRIMEPTEKKTRVASGDVTEVSGFVLSLS